MKNLSLNFLPNQNFPCPRNRPSWRVARKSFSQGTTKNKNRPHQPTIKFRWFLPINFLPQLAPPSCNSLPQTTRSGPSTILQDKLFIEQFRSCTTSLTEPALQGEQSGGSSLFVFLHALLERIHLGLAPLLLVAILGQTGLYLAG